MSFRLVRSFVSLVFIFRVVVVFFSALRCAGHMEIGLVYV